MNLSEEYARLGSPFNLFSPFIFSPCSHQLICVMLALVLSLVIVRVKFEPIETY